MTGEVSVGGMMGQAFSLRVLFRLQPKAALPWARMDEALGLAGKAEGLAGDAAGLAGNAVGLAGKAAGLMGRKAVGLGHRRGTGRRGHKRAARAVHRERLPPLAGLDPARLATALAGPVSGVQCPVSGHGC